MHHDKAGYAGEFFSRSTQQYNAKSQNGNFGKMPSQGLRETFLVHESVQQVHGLFMFDGCRVACGTNSTHYTDDPRPKECRRQKVNSSELPGKRATLVTSVFVGSNTIYGEHEPASQLRSVA